MLIEPLGFQSLSWVPRTPSSQACLGFVRANQAGTFGIHGAPLGLGGL